MFQYMAFHSLSFDSLCETESYIFRFKLVMPLKKRLHTKTHIGMIAVIYLSEAFLQFYSYLSKAFPPNDIFL